MNEESRANKLQRDSVDLEEDSLDHGITKQTTTINTMNQQKPVSSLIFQADDSNIFVHKQDQPLKRKPSQYKEMTENDLREITKAMNMAMGIP